MGMAELNAHIRQEDTASGPARLRASIARDREGRVFNVVNDVLDDPAGACAEIRRLREQLELEHNDIAMVEHEVAKVYCHITGGRVSKCNTVAAQVIAEADDRVEELIREAIAEERP